MGKRRRGVLVGVYPLGHENVALWVDPPDGGDTSGGWFQVQGPKGRGPSIHLLLCPSDGWEYVLGVLLHETREFVACKMRVRYDQSLRYDGNSAAHLFVYDHQQMTDMDWQQATFLRWCYGPLRRHWRRLARRH